MPTVFSGHLLNQTLRCRDQEISMQRVEAQAGSTEEDKSRSFLGFTRADAGWALFVYIIFFVCFRFDIRRHGISFQHPMATGKAALIAVPLAVVVAVLVKIRSQNGAGADYLTSLSLNDRDSQSKDYREP